MGGHHHVCLAPGDGGLGRGAENPAVGHHCDEAVNVGPEVQLDQVAVGEACVGLGEKGRVVADHVVDGDASREGDTFRNGNLSLSLVGLCLVAGIGIIYTLISKD